MNKKFTAGLLLLALIAGCSSNGTSSSNLSSNSSDNTNTSTDSSNKTSSSSTSSNKTSSSSTSSDRVYQSSVNIDTEKYPYIQSLGVDRNAPHNAYQILVYSFYDSDGDGYGDLRGVEQKLDYIKGLGSDIIWLSPIMPAESYHAYDVVSFYDIDERIGTLEDYMSLVNTAHSKNMKIMLDMPINHTSTNHEWFKGYLNDDPRYLDYYQEKNKDVTNGTSSSMGSTATFYIDEETFKTYYASFGASMPDLNFQSENVVNAIKDVFEYWVKLGADGFRFDAVKHIFDPNEIPAGSDSVAMNNALFKELGDHLKTISPDLYLLGENYSGQGEVKLYAESFDAEFDFDAWHTSLGAVTNQDPWGQSDRRKYYDDTIIGNSNELIGLNPNWVPTFMTGNHDVTRAASYIGDRVTDDDKAFKLYASMLMLRSGIPFVYYGDELGMYGENKSGDHFVEDAEIRMPMTFEDSTIDLEKMFYSKMIVYNNGNPTDKTTTLGANVLEDWPSYKEDNPSVEASIANSNSLYNTYKDLIAFRNEHPAIYNGTMSSVADYNGCATLFKMEYTGEDESTSETLYVALNFSESATTLKDVCDGTVDIIYNVNGASNNGTTIELESRGVAVFKATGTMNTNPEYIGGGSSGGNISSPDAPTEGYALYVTAADGSTRFISLTRIDELDGQGREQYFGDNIQLNAGDVFQLYNGTNGDAWVEKALESYGQYQSFEVTDNGIKCNVSGTYDLYAKFKWEDNTIYIGNENGQ